MSPSYQGKKKWRKREGEITDEIDELVLANATPGDDEDPRKDDREILSRHGLACPVLSWPFV